MRVVLQGRGRSFDFRCCSGNLVGHRASGERARLGGLGRSYDDLMAPFRSDKACSNRPHLWRQVAGNGSSEKR